MKPLLKVFKVPLVILNWLKWLFVTEEIAYLSFLMLALEFLGAIKAGLDLCPCKCICLCQLLKWDAWIESFVRLFSVEKASQNWFTMLLFFVTWLVGGGALVSVMVGRFYKKVAGEFRWWPCLVYNHVVVLGWDNGILMELVQELSKTQCKCFVITSSPVKEVERLLESAGISSSRYCVYHGDYDDEREWRCNLKVKEAQRIFIMGEAEEDAHDARVRILFDKVKNAVKTMSTGDENVDKEEWKIKVNIHDFGLANELIKTDKRTYENFHLNWANALWDEFTPELEKCEFDLYVVGFGAMGKAVVIRAGERFMPHEIYVSDDDDDKLKKEKERFVRQFGTVPEETKGAQDEAADEKDKKEEAVVKFKGVQIHFIAEWDTALSRLKNALKDREDKSKDTGNPNDKAGRKIVVVVAKKRSEKGMLCMMDIIKQVRNVSSGKVCYALDQEVEGYSIGSDIKMFIGDVKIHLFGMKRGCKWN